MKVNKGIPKTHETYTIEENDTFKIENEGKITKIFINGKQIKFVTRLELIHEVDKKAMIKIERLFFKEDFEEKNI